MVGSDGRSLVVGCDNVGGLCDLVRWDNGGVAGGCNAGDGWVGCE